MATAPGIQNFVHWLQLYSSTIAWALVPQLCL